MFSKNFCGLKEMIELLSIRKDQDGLPILSRRMQQCYIIICIFVGLKLSLYAERYTVVCCLV
jgi:hypothetical protein